MKTRECNIVEDLLPLYVEEMCSKESAAFVQKHLQHCSSCSVLGDELKRNKVKNIESDVDDNQSDFILKMHKKMNIKYKAAILKGAAIATAIILAVGTVYYIACKLKVSRVPNNNIDVNSYLTDDKDLMLQVIAKDGFTGGMINAEMDKTTHSLYLTIKRTLIKDESKNGVQDTYFYNIDTEQVNTVYIGTQNDKVLIWEKGDPVKSITDEELNRLYKQANDNFYKSSDKYYE